MKLEATSTLPSGHTITDRILPTSEIDQAVLSQIWLYQRASRWILVDGLPWKSASFGNEIVWESYDFAYTTLNFHGDHPPVSDLVQVFWTWRGGRIRANWAIDANKLNDCQINLAEYPVILRLPNHE